MHCSASSWEQPPTVISRLRTSLLAAEVVSVNSDPTEASNTSFNLSTGARYTNRSRSICTARAALQYLYKNLGLSSSMSRCSERIRSIRSSEAKQFHRLQSRRFFGGFIYSLTD